MHKRFDPYIIGNGFSKSGYDRSVYYKQIEGNSMYLLLYVNDVLIVCKYEN